jgi:multiple sugar transport system substrate-binding protein
VFGFMLPIGVFANGASEKPEAIKTLTMWCAYSQPDRISAIDGTIAKYEASHPGIKVVRELVPWSNIRQKWISAKMAGTLPQMVVGGDADLIALWTAGDLAPVDSVIEKVGGDQAFLPGPLNGLKMDGQTIAMPHYTLSWKMVVRKDLLEAKGIAIPKTWDEFAKAAIALTDAPNMYGFDIPMSKSAAKSREWLCYFMRTNGAEYFDKDGNVNFNTPQTVETVKFLVDLYKKTGRQAAVNYSENDCIDNFAKGTEAFIFAAGSLITNVKKINPDMLKNVAVIETPINTQVGTDGAGLVGIGKFKGVKYSEETDDFLAYLLTDEESYRNFLLSMSGMIPITVAAGNDTKYWSDPLIADYADLYKSWQVGAMTGKRIGLDYGPSALLSNGIPGSEIEDMFQAIIVDGIPVEKAVADTHNVIYANLKASGMVK